MGNSKKKRSGRNKSVLPVQELPDLEKGKVVSIPLSLIRPNPKQPRKIFHEASIKLLAASFNTRKDVDYPILVTLRKESGGKKFALIVDGERRWRAAGIAGLVSISCLIREGMSDAEVFLASARGNLHREAMNPIEEAYMILTLQNELMLNKTEIARNIGKSCNYIHSVLSYLNLHDDIQTLLLCGKIKKGIARQIAAYDQQFQINLVEVIEREMRKNNNSIHPNDVARILRKEAQKRKIKKVSERGNNTSLSHADLVARQVSVRGKKMAEILSEFLELGVKEISSVKSVYYLDILEELRNIKKAVDSSIRILDHIG